VVKHAANGRTTLRTRVRIHPWFVIPPASVRRPFSLGPSVFRLCCAPSVLLRTTPSPARPLVDPPHPPWLSCARPIPGFWLSVNKPKVAVEEGTSSCLIVHEPIRIQYQGPSISSTGVRCLMRSSFIHSLCRWSLSSRAWVFGCLSLGCGRLLDGYHWRVATSTTEPLANSSSYLASWLAKPIWLELAFAPDACEPERCDPGCAKCLALLPDHDPAREASLLTSILYAHEAKNLRAQVMACELPHRLSLLPRLAASALPSP